MLEFIGGVYAVLKFSAAESCARIGEVSGGLPRLTVEPGDVRERRPFAMGKLCA